MSRMPYDESDEPAGGRRSYLLPALLLAGGLAIRSLIRRARTIELAGRAVLITGGSRGLGLEIAREVGAQGAHVIICARDEDELTRAVEDLTNRGIDAFAIACDVSDREDVGRMMANIERHVGRLDVLINNAGIIQVGPADLMQHEDYERTMQIHFWGPLHTMQAAIPLMRKQGEGRIVNITSIGGRIPIAHLLPYTASKFALAGLSQGMRGALQRDNIYVTTVFPGLMRTGSPRNAELRGRHEAEYTWFSIADNLPGLTINSRRAARKIVAACRRGDAELVMPMQYRAAVIGTALFPELAADLLAATERALPSSLGGSVALRKGHDSTSRLSPSMLTALGDRAAARNNEL
jgi:NAD(P)-dependent dehydrogenase (short-subunit alcohol dehydrogenase family)